MQRADDLRRVAAECVEDLAADGVVYAEVRYAPEQHLERGLSLDDVVEAVHDGLRAGRGRRAARGPADRRPAAAHRHAARGQLARDRRAGGPPPRPRRLRLRHRRRRGRATRRPGTWTRSSTCSGENAHFTIHAGEAFGLPSIWEALQWCGAERLGHGVRIVDDIDGRRDGRAELGPARRLRPRPAGPAGDVPVVERADRRRAVDRRAPDRAAAPSCASG